MNLKNSEIHCQACLELLVHSTGMHKAPGVTYYSCLDPYSSVVVEHSGDVLNSHGAWKSYESDE